VHQKHSNRNQPQNAQRNIVSVFEISYLHSTHSLQKTGGQGVEAKAKTMAAIFHVS